MNNFNSQFKYNNLPTPCTKSIKDAAGIKTPNTDKRLKRSEIRNNFTTKSYRGVPLPPHFKVLSKAF